ncbi:hypothetical protein BDP27DRAFT_1319245, partial [Rhodocollybia butyracea]
MLPYMVSCCQTWYVSDTVRVFFVFCCISHCSPSTVLSVYLSLSFVPAHYITPLNASISLPHLLCFTHSIPTCFMLLPF